MYTVFCTFDIDDPIQNQSQSRSTYNEVYEEFKKIGLSREYNCQPMRYGNADSFGVGQGLMSGMGTTLLTSHVGSESGSLPSTSVVGRIGASSPMEAVRNVRLDVEAIFRKKRLKGQAFVIAATNDDCTRFVF